MLLGEKTYDIGTLLLITGASGIAISLVGGAILESTQEADNILRVLLGVSSIPLLLGFGFWGASD